MTIFPASVYVLCPNNLLIMYNSLSLRHISNKPHTDIFINIIIFNRDNSTHLERFHLNIRKHELYAENDTLVNQILHDMATAPILHVGKSKIYSYQKLENH